MWPSNKDRPIPLFVGVPVIMTHRVYILKAVEDKGSAPDSSATPVGYSILLIEWSYDR